MKRKLLYLLMALVTVFGMALPMASPALAAGNTGSIWTTNFDGARVNQNLYASKDAVYLNGGPAGHGDGLADGEYYVQVTEPDGTLLGTSIGSGDDTPAVVVAGSFEEIYQLSAILIKASDSTPGYDTTTNPGGEYKVWVSSVPDFTGGTNKTDNFKVVEEGGGGAQEIATITVIKFYDADLDGVKDDTEAVLDGWKINFNGDDAFTTFSTDVEPGTYTVSEYDPIETNWVHTTPTSVDVTVGNGEDATVYFGNVCTDPNTGGKTLGFWSNKNGQALLTAGDFTELTTLNLRNATGSPRDFTGTLTQNKSALKDWLLNGTATNMAYMLSVQLSATELSVNHSGLSGTALVYAPDLLDFAPITGLNALGFISVNDLMTAANSELGTHGTAFSGADWRAYQETLKNYLDDLNNNRADVLSSTPCPYTFAP